MTSKLNLYDTIQTFGQCQYPVGREGATDDFFCFVNADSACGDKVPYGNEEKGLYVTIEACKDPKAPKPRAGGNAWVSAGLGLGLLGLAAVFGEIFITFTQQWSLVCAYIIYP